jgi:hypothetical protein
MGNNDKFWLEDFKVLFTNFCSFNPLSNKSTVENLNAYTRFLLIVMIVIYALTKELKYIFICLALIVLIVIIYYIFKPSNFSNVNNSNGSNGSNGNNGSNGSNGHNSVSVPEYAKEQLKRIQKPNRESDYFDSNVEENNPLKNTPIQDYGREQKFSGASPSSSDMTKFVNGKMFLNPDQYIFERNTREFYTMPNTSVPNDRAGFANWLYGTENNCKYGSIFMHRTGTPEQCAQCTGFDVRTPTNFGNLNDAQTNM